MRVGVALALLGVAAALAVHALGLKFIYTERSWQVLPGAWLSATPLAQIVLELHAQPPALTVLQWLDVNLAPGAMPAASLAAYAVLIAASGLAVHALTGQGWAGLLAGLLVALSPSAILYSRFWFSTIFCAALVAAFAAIVAIGARRRSGPGLAAASLPLALAATFHAAFAGVLVALVAVLSLVLGRDRSFTRRAGAFPLLALALAIASATPVKNWLHFGVFTPSSWAPLNLITAISGWSVWGECDQEIRRQPPPDPGESRGAVLMTRAPTEPRTCRQRGDRWLI